MVETTAWEKSGSDLNASDTESKNESKAQSITDGGGMHRPKQWGVSWIESMENQKPDLERHKDFKNHTK